jgi:hypothetical protein
MALINDTGLVTRDMLAEELKKYEKLRNKVDVIDVTATAVQYPTARAVLAAIGSGGGSVSSLRLMRIDPLTNKPVDSSNPVYPTAADPLYVGDTSLLGKASGDYAIDNTSIYKWNGSNWILQGPFVGNTGDVYVTRADNSMAIYDGNKWVILGGRLPDTVLQKDDIPGGRIMSSLSISSSPTVVSLNQTIANVVTGVTTTETDLLPVATTGGAGIMTAADKIRLEDSQRISNKVEVLSAAPSDDKYPSELLMSTELDKRALITRDDVTASTSTTVLDMTDCAFIRLNIATATAVDIINTIRGQTYKLFVVQGSPIFPVTVRGLLTPKGSAPLLLPDQIAGRGTLVIMECIEPNVLILSQYISDISLS